MDKQNWGTSPCKKLASIAGMKMPRSPNLVTVTREISPNSHGLLNWFETANYFTCFVHETDDVTVDGSHFFMKQPTGSSGVDMPLSCGYLAHRNIPMKFLSPPITKRNVICIYQSRPDHTHQHPGFQQNTFKIQAWQLNLTWIPNSKK